MSVRQRLENRVLIVVVDPTPQRVAAAHAEFDDYSLSQHVCVHCGQSCGHDIASDLRFVKIGYESRLLSSSVLSVIADANGARADNRHCFLVIPYPPLDESRTRLDKENPAYAENVRLMTAARESGFSCRALG